MVYKGDLAIDPRGLIYEAYRMEIGPEECRSIFLDWAMGTALGADMTAMLHELLEKYADTVPGHAMTEVLREGLVKLDRPVGRRGGRLRNA
jgi:hypothetical protein